MNEIQIVKIVAAGKTKSNVKFDNGVTAAVYNGEIRKFDLVEGRFMPEDEYDELIQKVLGKRATKRAMHLLEKMDRTEKQVRDKLKQNGYPDDCIQIAVDYLYKFHYLDDERYARNYINGHQNCKSKQKLFMDLMSKGIDRETIEFSLEEEYEADEDSQIRKLLEKKKFDYENADQKEFKRVYSFLLRRGFKSSDILRQMKYKSDFYD
ncbi:regulatory protein [Lachnospiraceae bacterium C7]|nr:regulatory protein [Lachnospiraceae bacterium C7]